MIELDLFTNWGAFSFNKPRNTRLQLAQEVEEIISEASASPVQ